MKNSQPPLKTVKDSSETDRIFNTSAPVADFKFNTDVAGVFDDMVSRSVPFYDEMQRMITELSADFAVRGTNVYDLGCSTGTTFEMLHPVLDPGVSFVGIDNSQAMLDKAQNKLQHCMDTRMVSLLCADIENAPPPENASVVLMVLTLQFVRPLHRERIVRRIYDAMLPNSALIVVEKLLSADGTLNRLYIDHYYDYKRRNGYSDTEISKKREALENVLIPYRLEENVELFKSSGFRHVEDFFRWYNFSGIIAMK